MFRARTLVFALFLVPALACSERIVKVAPPDPGSDSEATEPPSDATPPTDCAATMRWKPYAFTGSGVYVDTAAAAGGDGTAEAPFADLQEAIDAAPDGSIVHIAAGTYAAAAKPYTDPTCANCSQKDQKATQASLGFSVKGKSLSLEGPERGEARLVTNAGYGVLVEDACETHLTRLKITGGVRDRDGAAGDGAVVARRSRVMLDHVHVDGNDALGEGDSKYPGIIGVAVREGADVLLVESEISNNSWDGVAVYWQGKARVYGSKIHHSNGVGVGVTFDGKAEIVGNTIWMYWKGIGAFAEAEVEATNNVIREQRGWGIATSGNGRLTFVNNTIAYNSQLGVLANRTARLVMKNNAIVGNGHGDISGYDPDTFGQGGIRGPASAPGGAVDATHNVFFDNEPRDWTLADGKTPNEGEPGAESGDTNRNVDPEWTSKADLTPTGTSPLLHSGDPTIKDKDGEQSSVGHTGGPRAGLTRPE